MDKLNRYRQLVERILTGHTKIPYSHGEVGFETIFDRSTDRYLVMLVGWEKVRRVHGCLIHVDIIDGKIWIQRDGTEEGVPCDLLEAGVPREDIFMAFRIKTVPDQAQPAVA